MRIALLFEPSREPTIPFAAGPERYQRLADELSRYSATQVQIIKDILRNAPNDSYVLFAGGGDISRSLADCGPALAARLAPRIVLLDVSWQSALEHSEKHRLAGALDSLRLSEWLARPSSCTGPFGLRYLTKPLEASCVPMPAFRSDHYCLLQSQHHRGMPHLLADYLAAYDRDQQPLSTVLSVVLARVRQALTNGPLGHAPTRAGQQRSTAPSAQVESVSTKRAINSLKRAREFAHITVQQVADRSGFDHEQLSLLEGSDYTQATLGTLRAYFLAMEPTLGWTLADTREPTSPGLHTSQDWVQIRKNDVPTIAPGIEGAVAAADLSELSALSAESPWVVFEGGMTVLGNRRPRRRELDKPNDRMQKEESYAGV